MVYSTGSVRIAPTDASLLVAGLCGTLADVTEMAKDIGGANAA